MAGQRDGAIYSVSIHLAQRRDLEVKLDQAIDTAIDAASGHPGLGILVSRHDRQTLTVELSEEAPCRTIVERDLGTPTPEETCLSFSRHRVLEPHFSLS